MEFANINMQEGTRTPPDTQKGGTTHPLHFSELLEFISPFSFFRGLFFPRQGNNNVGGGDINFPCRAGTGRGPRGVFQWLIIRQPSNERRLDGRRPNRSGWWPLISSSQLGGKKTFRHDNVMDAIQTLEQLPLLLVPRSIYNSDTTIQTLRI